MNLGGCVHAPSRRAAQVGAGRHAGARAATTRPPPAPRGAPLTCSILRRGARRDSTLTAADTLGAAAGAAGAAVTAGLAAAGLATATAGAAAGGAGGAGFL